MTGKRGRPPKIDIAACRAEIAAEYAKGGRGFDEIFDRFGVPQKDRQDHVDAALGIETPISDKITVPHAYLMRFIKTGDPRPVASLMKVCKLRRKAALGVLQNLRGWDLVARGSLTLTALGRETYNEVCRKI